MDKVKVANDGATEGSMGGMSASDLARGYSSANPEKKVDQFGFPMDDRYKPQNDGSGTNYVGDTYERKQIGVCGRPSGEER